MIKREIPPVGHGLTLLMLLMLAAWARIRVTMLDFNSLLTSYLADDAFYYYKIAANVSNLHRITYDGEQLSNGFHPLWLALITPFYTAANDGIDFVYRVQWIMFCCSLFTVIALYCTLSRLRTGWLCATMVTAIFCIHSTFVDMQMNGLETSLNSLVLLLLFNAFLTVYLQPDSPVKRYWYFGFIAALAFLTRTDNAISLLILFSMLLLGSRRNWAVSYRMTLLAGFVCFLVAAPWLIWNQINFGSLVQGSGKVETIYWGEPKFSLVKTLFSLLFAPQRLLDAMQSFFSWYALPVGRSSIFAGVAFSAWVLSMVFFFCSQNSSRTVKAISIFCFSVLCVFSYHVVIRSFVRVWYFVPIGIIFLLSIAGVVLYVKDSLVRLGFGNAANIFPSVILAAWLIAVATIYSPENLNGHIAELSPHLVVSQWIDENTPSDAIVGSMNSGILSYLVHRKVVNLDGVVDQRTMQALWKKDHLSYLHERGVDYLVDNDGALAIYCAENPLHTCERIFAFGDQRNPSRVVRVVDKNSNF